MGANGTCKGCGADLARCDCSETTVTHFAALNLNEDLDKAMLILMDNTKTISIVVEWDLQVLATFVVRAMYLLDEAKMKDQREREQDSGG